MAGYVTESARITLISRKIFTFHRSTTVNVAENELGSQSSNPGLG